MKEHESERGLPAFFRAGLPPLYAALLLAVALLLSALALPLLASCSSPVDTGLDDMEEVELPDDRFQMELAVATGQGTGSQDSGGGPVRIIVSPDFAVSRERYATLGQQLQLEFKKNRPAAVLAYLPSKPRPAGAIYPYTTRFQEKDGYAAEILWELYNEDACTEAEKENVRMFNWHKLLEALREQDDPWLVDSERIKEAIRSGKFSKSKIKKWVKKPS